MQPTDKQVATATAAITSQIGPLRPRVGVILGSGLGGLADRIDPAAALRYDDLPHFPRSTAAGHAGRLIVGRLSEAGPAVVALQGRFHSYEGWTAQQAAFPVAVLRGLGVDTLVVSNAAGGLNPSYAVGQVMLIDDQVNLMFQNPLGGQHEQRHARGRRTRSGSPMAAPYDHGLMRVAEATARRRGFSLPRGVYVGMLGPTYETRAEYRMCRRLGGDAAGMSTVPEVIAARHAGMRVLGLSVITNACSPDQLSETTHEEVVAAAGAASERLRWIVKDVVAGCSSEGVA